MLNIKLSAKIETELWNSTFSDSTKSNIALNLRIFLIHVCSRVNLMSIQCSSSRIIFGFIKEEVPLGEYMNHNESDCDWLKKNKNDEWSLLRSLLNDVVYVVYVFLQMRKSDSWISCNWNSAINRWKSEQKRQIVRVLPEFCAHFITKDEMIVAAVDVAV